MLRCSFPITHQLLDEPVTNFNLLITTIVANESKIKSSPKHVAQYAPTIYMILADLLPLSTTSPKVMIRGKSINTMTE